MILLHCLKMVKTKSIKNSVKDDFSQDISKVIRYIKEELNIRDDQNINYFEEDVDIDIVDKLQRNIYNAVDLYFMSQQKNSQIHQYKEILEKIDFEEILSKEEIQYHEELKL